MDDDYLDLIGIAEEAEKVRGQHHSEWWPEVQRLKEAKRWDDYEQLLTEIRDATERGAELAGWTIATAAAIRLAYFYDEQGHRGKAVTELERCLAAIDRYRQVEPEGGDAGYRRVSDLLAVFRNET